MEPKKILSDQLHPDVDSLPPLCSGVQCTIWHPSHGWDQHIPGPGGFFGEQPHSSHRFPYLPALFRQQTRMGLGKFPGRGQCRKRTEGKELDAWVYDLCAPLPVYRDLHYGHHSSFPEITKHSFVTLELDMLPI